MTNLFVRLPSRTGPSKRVSSGDEAIKEARTFRPDLALVDVMMPGMDGFQLAQKLRSDRETALTPIIFLSARGQTADKVRAFRSGAGARRSLRRC